MLAKIHTFTRHILAFLSLSPTNCICIPVGDFCVLTPCLPLPPTPAEPVSIFLVSDFLAVPTKWTKAAGKAPVGDERV